MHCIPASANATTGPKTVEGSLVRRNKGVLGDIFLEFLFQGQTLSFVNDILWEMETGWQWRDILLGLFSNGKQKQKQNIFLGIEVM